MKTIRLNLRLQSAENQPWASWNQRSFVYFILLLVSFVCCLTGSKPVHAQTYGTPLFTEDFGTVPTGQDANSYRGEITGRGTIGNTFWFWPYSCPVAGQRWLTDFTPTLEISYALVLPAREQGITEWTIVQVTELTTGLPYNTGYVNNPNNTWCLYEEKSGEIGRAHV